MVKLTLIVTATLLELFKPAFTQAIVSNEFRNGNTNDVVFNENFLFENQAKSSAHCAVMCSSDRECVTFSFNKVTPSTVCRGHSSVMMSENSQNPAIGSRTYTLKGNTSELQSSPKPTDTTVPQITVRTTAESSLSSSSSSSSSSSVEPTDTTAPISTSESADTTAPQSPTEPTEETSVPYSTAVSTTAATVCTVPVSDCAQALSTNTCGGNNGVYTLSVGGTAMQVFCDQTTDGGGWLVFQRRQDGSVDFYRNWTDYKFGFGNVAGEYWLGLESLHILTTAKLHELRVDMVRRPDGVSGYAKYSLFRVDGENTQYLNQLGAHTGNCTDYLNQNGGQRFSTLDVDNDYYGGSNAVERHSGFWFGYDSYANPNGDYFETASSKRATHWGDLNGNPWALSCSFMEYKIRPK